MCRQNTSPALLLRAFFRLNDSQVHVNWIKSKNFLLKDLQKVWRTLAQEHFKNSNKSQVKYKEINGDSGLLHSAGKYRPKIIDSATVMYVDVWELIHEQTALEADQW